MSTDPLDRLLSHTLRDGHTADVCPDAEQLAAFVEQALGRDDSKLMERHVSACARCAAIVSTLVASEPVAASAAPAAWRLWPAWRWAVTAMTAVAIAGLWFASTRRGSETAEKPLVVASRDLGTESRDSAADNLEGRVPAPEPDRRAKESVPASPPASSVASSELTKDREAAPVRAEAAKSAADTAPPAAPAAQAPPARAVNSQAAESQLQQTAKEEAAAPAQNQDGTRRLGDLRRLDDVTAADPRSADEARARDAAAPPPPPAAAPGPPPVSAAPAAVARGGGGGGGRGGGRGGGPAGAGGSAAAAGRASGTAAAPPDAAQQGRVMVDGLSVRQFAPVILRNRSGTTQWRLSGVSVERSGDGGATYAPAYTASRPLTAGAVATDDTVWLAGEAGLVVRGTADGWTVAAAPGAADLIEVSEVTARGATVRERDGRELRTEDGGATWRSR